MTKFPDIFMALAAPFDPREIKTRSGGGGRQLSYITARQAQNRLDSVVGPENWRNHHRLESLPGGMSAIVCAIEIRIDGEWIGKEDAGGFKIMTERNREGQNVEDEENTVKTAYSDAFKRAASLWGIGRHLYGDGYANLSESEGDHRPPESKVESAPPPQRRDPAPNGNGHGNGQSLPRSGKAFFAWLKDMEPRTERPLLKKANAYGKKRKFPDRVIDWTPEQVAETLKKVQDLLSRPEDEPEPEAEHRPSESKVGTTDPIAIAKGDPLGALKAEIVQSVMQLEYARLGRTATSREVMDRIECNAAALANGETFETVGGCRDRPWLVAIAAELKREVEALRVFERESRGGAA